MYAPFFGLQQAPFSIAPDPHYLFMSERHREALAHLLYGLQGGGGFVLLTGEIGAGKTTVCRCFLEQIPPDCNVAYIFNPKLSAIELLQTVCDEFHVPVPPGAQTVKDYVDPLNAFLLAQHAAGRNNVLIIDEAQNLAPEVLEQLRLLTNLETSERKLLQVVLIGQPELREMLARPELEQLAQRVIARFHLGALSEAETAQYVGHRLQVAGLAGPLPFDGTALRLVHRLSRGVPRRINLLCDRALLGAYARNQAQVTRAVVRKAAVEVFDSGEAGGGQGLVWTLVGLLLVAAGVAGAVLWMGGRDSVVKPAAPAASLPASAAASAAAPVASAPAPAASAPPPVFSLADWQPLAAEAWPALAEHWGLSVPEGAEPCAAAASQGLQCHRSSTGSLSLIRLLDRPVLLSLQRPGQATAQAVLLGLTDTHATLWLAGAPRRVDLAELARAWRGEFVTLWRMPPGYAQRADDAAPLRAWVAAQLAPSQPASGPAPDLTRELQAFQARQGLQPDGRLGPITLMLLNRSAGVAEPRLAH
jgi:general secretion pathway protein A